jgi:hypothetical protein
MMENVNKVKSQRVHKGFALAVRFSRTAMLILLVSMFAYGFNQPAVSSTTHDDVSESGLAYASGSMMLVQSVVFHSTNHQDCSSQIVCHAPVLLETVSFSSLAAFKSLPHNFTAKNAPKGQIVSVILPPPLA